MKHLLPIVLAGLIVSECWADEVHNTLSEQEKAQGMLLLWDGETTFGWHSSNGSKWTVQDGMLSPQAGKDGMLVTTTAFTDYELIVDYRTRPGSEVVIRIGALADGTPPEGFGKKDVPLNHFGAGWARVRVQVQAGYPVGTEYRSLGALTGIGQATRGAQTDDMPRHLGHIALIGSGVIYRNIKLQPRNPTILFNGKDLTGWKVHPDRKSKFSITPEGWLRIQDGPGDLQTTESYSDFLFQVDCKTNGERLNSGVFFRCIADQYQQGYEAQIHNGFTDKPMKQYKVDEFDPKTHTLKETHEVTSAAMDYGTGAIYRRIPARRSVAKDKEWFTMTVVAHGRHIATWVDGIQVVDWTDNRPINENPRQGCRLEAGRISLQGHDPTTDLLFRNFRVIDMSTKK